MNDDCKDILSRYIKGDNQAVAEIYAHFKDQLLLIAYNYCRDSFISRDIIHDIFEKLILLPIDKRNSYFGNVKSNFIGYLSIFIKNKCIDTKKIGDNRERIIQSIRHTIKTESYNDSLERFLYDALNEMLNNLQPKEKEILSLHLQGYTNEEIAVQLHITYNTVKNNIYEAKKKLKEMWTVFMN